MLRRHPFFTDTPRWGNMEVVIPLSLVCISSKINWLTISPQKSLPILSLAPGSLLLLIPLPTLIESFQEFCCSQQGSDKDTWDWESH